MTTARPSVLVRRDHFQALFDALRTAGYEVIGPTIRDGAIIYDALRNVEELPIAWTDEQECGTYRLKRRSDQALFGYVVGPQSWKKYLFPPRVKLLEAQRDGKSFHVVAPQDDPPRLAFLGVRSCELHAIAVQDKVFLGGDYVDPIYKLRRERVFIVAVQCGLAGKTCFCASTNTGPCAEHGFDLAVTELLTPKRHAFLFEIGSERGAEVLARIPHERATPQDESEAREATARATRQMGRALDTTNVRELLQTNYEHPRWEEVAQRCVTCANCTLVCPTCFCSTVEDVTDLTGDHAERWRRWDSCFTMDFSYIHGGEVRNSTKSRYRQWLVHKLSTWHDQFGVSGCVGCGRCLTWCPVGIDLTEEIRALRSAPVTPAQEPPRGNH